MSDKDESPNYHVGKIGTTLNTNILREKPVITIFTCLLQISFHDNEMYVQDRVI